MRRNNLVVSTRGPGGGYRLSTSPEDICVSDIISAVDDKLEVANKDALPGVSNYEPCLTEQLWEELSDQISNYLNRVSLADMLRNQEEEAESKASAEVQDSRDSAELPVNTH
mgnify:CR=1 FL=1